MTFELNQLAMSDEAALHLKHPATEMPLYADAKETKAVEVVLKGQASQTYRRAVDAMIKKNNKRGNKAASPEEARQEGIDFLVALSVEIKNLTLDGQPVDNSEAFRKLYADERFSWIKTQINEFLGDVGSFLK